MNLNVTITMPELFISGVSFESEQPLKFILRIETFKHMNPSRYSSEITELGINLF